MTTSTSHDLDPSVIESRLEILGSLDEAFAADFRFAVRGEDSQWRYLAADQITSGDGPTLDLAQAEACNQVLEFRKPCVVSAIDPSYTVVIPLAGGMPTAQVALGDVPDIPSAALERMAQLWVAAAASKQQAAQYRVENDYFAEQLTEDLEELSYLRSMVEGLDMSDQANGLMALAESTLPQLNESVKSESLSLLLVPEGVDPVDAIPTISIGDQPIAESLQVRIVQQFGSTAVDQPVVKNRLDSAPEGAELQGVRELILVPLRSRSRQLGWLLAVNRLWPAGEMPNSDWPLSHLEFGTNEASLLTTTGSILATHASNLELFREKEQMLVGVVRSLVSAIDAKDKYTCGHSERVALFGRILAEQTGYDENQCERLYLTGLLHDVGKIGVSDAVLNKEGKLTDEEYAEIKRHPDEGWAILQDLEQLRYVLPGVLFHHERVDGGGYPDGLSGSNIPMDGRLLAVVDAYDAMTSDRPYRAGMPPKRAQEILRDGAGTQWDAELIDNFFAVLPKIEHIRETHQLRERPTRNHGCSI